ncbi:thiamine-phosphate pyrophosphorylase [Helicobacter didelphidarum]|uniref:Thiamine-phosphate pyrophosphorylase n=1 Tax=Helicobacter didelphidarum TaxID=2040648 RepID=A0A3D8ICS4_9HELI|nr:thiamine-phosphate pyrophosphorylase [Helicobacter didelphidarum]RDU62845.1 thiamine-phosphate pyrophosphorylase [Helicobacter didelphidarum]
MIDANLNRLKEGIRVIEDIFRFIYNDKEIAYQLKKLRHLAIIDNYNEILQSRDIINDIAKESIATEIYREDIGAILHANFCRICESARVLEECLKLENYVRYGKSETFKQIRYEAYNLHKVCSLKINLKTNK